MNVIALKNDLAQMKALRWLVSLSRSTVHDGDLDADARLRDLDKRISITEGAITLCEMPSDLPPSKVRKDVPLPPPPTTLTKGGF